MTSIHPPALLRELAVEFDGACPVVRFRLRDSTEFAQRLARRLRAGGMTLEEFKRGLERLRRGYIAPSGRHR